MSLSTSRAVLLALLPWLATGLGCAQAAPAPGIFRPDPATCAPATAAQRAWLTPEWTQFADAVRVCALREGRAEPKLLVVSVWSSAWMKDKPDGTAFPQAPAPWLVAPDGHRLGTLPSGFPDDPPARLELRPLAWKAGLPQEIHLCIRTPAASGDQPLAPLRWRAAEQRYESTDTDPEPSLHDDCHAH